MKLRAVEPRDFEPLWHWRRAIGDVFTWADHLQWCTDRLGGGSWWVGENTHGVSVGVLRIDWAGDDPAPGWVSLQVNPGYTGRGYGLRLLAELPVGRPLWALIHPENMPSRRVFVRVGFDQIVGSFRDGYDCFARGVRVSDAIKAP